MKKVDKDSVYQKLASEIKSRKKGSVFLSDDLGLADKAVLRVYLSRMVGEGLITRLAPGVFFIPRYSDVLRAIIPPDIDDVATAISRSERARIIPVGSYSLYKAGLSTQVPTVAVYGTDGAARVIKLYDGRSIRFKAVAAKNFAYRNAVMQIAVSAMREIGENRITDEQIDLIRNLCSQVDRKEYVSDLRLAPEWISKKLRVGGNGAY
ncbi:MAG: hypothetical protein IJS84_10855 [Spirochaetales bacterium]|nr:hypothetical protein [Spirochaetales bacterium]MBR1582371.1 hypothetical protein [Spirochaetales bacterium]